MAPTEIRSDSVLAIGCDHFHRFNSTGRSVGIRLEFYSLRIRFPAILGEHSRHHVHHDIKLCLISGGNIDEDIAGVKGDLAVF